MKYLSRYTNYQENTRLLNLIDSVDSLNEKIDIDFLKRKGKELLSLIGINEKSSIGEILDKIIKRGKEFSYNKSLMKFVKLAVAGMLIFYTTNQLLSVVSEYRMRGIDVKESGIIDLVAEELYKTDQEKLATEYPKLQKEYDQLMKDLKLEEERRKQKKIGKKGKKIEPTEKETTKGDLGDYMNALSTRESSNDPGVVNQSGYMGLYQFGEDALRDVGLYHITKSRFLKDPSCFPIATQNKAMLQLLRNNYGYVGKEYFEKYVGKTIGGIKITVSGLLAGSHLRGNRYVKEFLDSNGRKDKRDGNGTPVSEYIRKFGGYDVSNLFSINANDVVDVNDYWKSWDTFRSWDITKTKISPNQKGENKQDK